MREPLLVNRLEGVFAGNLSFEMLFLPRGTRVDAFCEERVALVSKLTRLS